MTYSQPVYQTVLVLKEFLEREGFMDRFVEVVNQDTDLALLHAENGNVHELIRNCGFVFTNQPDPEAWFRLAETWEGGGLGRRCAEQNNVQAIVNCFCDIYCTNRKFLTNAEIFEKFMKKHRLWSMFKRQVKHGDRIDMPLSQYFSYRSPDEYITQAFSWNGSTEYPTSLGSGGANAWAGLSMKWNKLCKDLGVV